MTLSIMKNSYFIDPPTEDSLWVYFYDGTYMYYYHKESDNAMWRISDSSLASWKEQIDILVVPPKLIKLYGIPLYTKSTTTKKRQHEKTKSKKTRTKGSSTRH